MWALLQCFPPTDSKMKGAWTRSLLVTCSHSEHKRGEDLATHGMSRRGTRIVKTLNTRHACTCHRLRLRPRWCRNSRCFRRAGISVDLCLDTSGDTLARVSSTYLLVISFIHGKSARQRDTKPSEAPVGLGANVALSLVVSEVALWLGQQRNAHVQTLICACY